MRPLENEGSGVRSMRTMAGTPKPSEFVSDLSEPSRATAWVVGSTIVLRTRIVFTWSDETHPR
jgi:hypothetical protein